MAVSTSSITSFAVVGVPMTTSDFDVYESTTSPKRALGFKVETVSGDIYRWAHFGAATNRGMVVSQDISESSYVDTDDVMLAPASCVNTNDGKVGSYFVEITLASITANQFAGGKLVITDDTGEAYTYPIVGNTATGNPASGTFRIELKRPLQVAVDATSDFAIVGNPYGNLEPASATDFDIVGVAMQTQAAGDYGWVMTQGVVGALSDNGAGLTPALGKGIVVASATAGSVQEASATSDNVFGYCIVAPDPTGHGVFKISCE